MANMGQNDFNARIKRIKSPRNTSYYDPDLGMDVPKRVSHAEIRRNARAGKTNLVGVLGSLMIGGGALMIAQAVRFRYLGMSDASNATVFTDLLLAVLVVTTVTAVMRYRKLSYRVYQVMGAAAMFVAGHNLMWYYPDQLAVVYTAEYVELVRDSTVPLSLVFRDMTISL